MLLSGIHPLNCKINRPRLDSRFSGNDSRTLLLVSSLILHLSSLSFAVGGTSGGTLLRSPGAKPLGMSESYVSLDADEGGVVAAHYNPASTAWMKSREFSFMGQKGVADDSFGTLTLGLPSGIGNFAGSFVYYSVGDIDLINSQGQQSTVKAQQDLSASFNYSRILLDKFSAGATIKVLNSKLLDSFSATAFAIDVGGHAKFQEDRLTVGAAVSNVGTGLKYLNTNEPLPLTLQAGASQRWSFEEWGNIILSGDLVSVKDEKVKELIGGEYLWNHIVALRGGYKIGQDLGKYSFGFGITVGSLQIDYAMTDGGRLGFSHSASVAFKFGGQNSEVHRVERTEEGKRISLAVLNLQTDQANLSESATISDKLRIAFAKKRRIFSRDQEIKEKYISLICNDLDCAVRIGRELKVQKVLIGSLAKYGGVYNLNVKLVDVSSGRVEANQSGKSFFLKDMDDTIDDLVEELTKAVKSYRY